MLVLYVLIPKDHQIFCCTDVASVRNLSSFSYIMMVFDYMVSEVLPNSKALQLKIHIIVST